MNWLRLSVLSLGLLVVACGGRQGYSFDGEGGGTGTSGAGGTETSSGGNASSGGSSGSGGIEATGGAVSATGGQGTGGQSAATPVALHGQLEVVGNQLRNAHGQAVTLRGQGHGWDNWWPQYYNADVVKWLRDDWRLDIVRPAMGIEPRGAYLDNPNQSKARIRAVVDAAIENDIYVIIDWHAHDLHQSQAVAFFSEMAQAYGSYPHVIYEVVNEPDNESWAEVKAYAEAVIAAIRQHDPDNIVIVGCPEWDQRVDQVADNPITSYSNIVYALHFYAASHGRWLRERAAGARAKGIPLFVSESSGMDASGSGAIDYNQWEAWFDFMDSNDISWLNYSISDKAGEACSTLQPGANARGAWTDAELTETGKYIRAKLRSYKQ
jgi:endoglucanase